MKRNSNLEIIRIIAILFIIISHYFSHGIGIDSQSLNIINSIFSDILKLGNLGTILFIMICGYFYNIDFKRNKVVNLMLQVTFYSLIFYILFIFIGTESFSALDFIKNTFSCLFYNYWFITGYLIIYVLSPYFQKIIDGITKKELKKLIIIITCIWCVIPWLINPIYGNSFMFSTKLTSMLVPYFIGAYIKKYGIKIDEKKEVIYLPMSIIAIVIGVIASHIFGLYFNSINKIGVYLMDEKNLILLIISALIISVQSKKQNWSNNKINKLASLSLGIYLIHDNDYVRNFIWDFLKVKDFMNSSLMIFHALVCVFMIYFICGFIEYLRDKLFYVIKRLYKKESEF